MRVNIGPKPYITPMPVLVVSSYDKAEQPCAMLVAWGAVSGMKEITLFIDPRRYTLKGILDKKSFVISVADEKNYLACDYLGIESGNDISDKFFKSGFRAIKSEFVDAPIIKELPFAVECRLKSYDEESWSLVGEIINISIDEDILDEKGKVSYDKFRPIAFDWMNLMYMSMGDKVGNAFKDGKKLK